MSSINPRSTWSAQTIRAVDLVDNDDVLIGGRWREVLDTWQDTDDPAAQFGDDHETTKAIEAKTAWFSPCWIAVRYVDEDNSTPDEIHDRLHFFRLRDLVQVQREHKPDPAEDGPLADLLTLMSPLDLRGALRAGAELHAAYGDPNDEFSSSQRRNLRALAEHFAHLDAQ
ncbi:hypothetical protein E0L36_22005 [Streptomyces sp. AJS327]|uniref:hypothetical protein n=1 Tax=Streptomyces sp. AJS327 TaxID=2545265 RepID=UPI0015DE87CC|nr:hypothetical protein [Streptomyces sp. AJS327]MBA0053451.1 hypothetical protein [Streptomyces sp. AJS327]